LRGSSSDYSPLQLVIVSIKLILRSLLDGFALPGKPKLYVVKRKGIINQLDQIKVDATEKSIDLELANNKNSDTGPDKLKLSDIMMAVYVEKTKQKPEDLAIVRFVRITEDGTNKAIRDAKKKLGLGDLEKFDVSSDSDGKKEEIFEDLKNTALGKAAEWLHKDFDTGKIEKIFVTDGVEQGTMTIHFDD